MIQAIIFDFDGTILDTELYDYQSWQEICQEYDVHLPLELWLHQVGTVSDFDPHRFLEEQAQRQLDRALLRQRRHGRFLDLVAAEPLRPGVLGLIQEAHEAGLRLGVASSGTRDWVEGHLTTRNLRHYFGVVRTAADVQRVKPDPELYLSALTALGVEPKYAVAIEDSRHGMIAAKLAGMKCVVAPNPITQGLDFSEADLVVQSLAELTLETILQFIEP